MRLLHSSFSRTCLRLKKGCGFTLLETAIVLGVIGVAVSVLFVTAGTVEYRASVNQASEELNQISQNMRNLFAGRSTSYAALGPLNLVATNADFTNFSAKVVQQNVFPNEMLSPPVAPGTIPPAGTIAYTPWRALAQVALAGSAATPIQYVIRYNSLRAEVCSDLLMRNSLPGRETGLTQIIVSSGITYTNAARQLPVTSLAANAACSGRASYNVDWYYSL